MTEISTVSVQELKKMRDENPDVWIIDVRELHEWQSEHIPGALHIPKDQIAEKIQKNIPYLDCPVYLHCGGGKRSLDAAKTLQDMGFEQVYSVDGGINAWKKHGYPLVGSKL